MKRIFKSNYFMDQFGNVFNEKLKKIQTDENDIFKINLGQGRKRYPKWRLYAQVYLKNWDIEKEVLVPIDGDFRNISLKNYKIELIENIGKKIEGYEDYIVTKSGIVYSLKNGRLNMIIPTNGKNNKYQFVRLMKNNKGKNFLVHRLVAKAYIPNPFNKPQVDHIDGDILNNNVENLRWVTSKENINYMFKKQSPVRNFKKCSLLDEDGNCIKDFNTITECINYAEKNFGCSKSMLSKHRKHKGYTLKTF